MGRADAAQLPEYEAEKAETQKHSGHDAHLLLPDADARGALHRITVSDRLRAERDDAGACAAVLRLQCAADPAGLLCDHQDHALAAAPAPKEHGFE